MSYGVLVEPKAKRELGKVPYDDFLKIDAAIWALEGNPRPFGVKKLEEDIHRIRVGAWRIIYAIFDGDRRVIILRVVRRSERTYRDLGR